MISEFQYNVYFAFSFFTVLAIGLYVTDPAGRRQDHEHGSEPNSKNNIEIVLSAKSHPTSDGGTAFSITGIKVKMNEADEPAIESNPEVTYVRTTTAIVTRVEISTGEEPVWIDWGDGQREQVPANAENLVIRHDLPNLGEKKRITVTGKDFELHSGGFRKVEATDER